MGGDEDLRLEFLSGRTLTQKFGCTFVDDRGVCFRDSSDSRQPDSTGRGARFPSVIVSFAPKTTRNGRETVGIGRLARDDSGWLGMAREPGEAPGTWGPSGNRRQLMKPPVAGETANRSWRPHSFCVHTVYCSDEHILFTSVCSNSKHLARDDSSPN